MRAKARSISSTATTPEVAGAVVGSFLTIINRDRLPDDTGASSLRHYQLVAIKGLGAFVGSLGTGVALGPGGEEAAHGAVLDALFSCFERADQSSVAAREAESVTPTTSVWAGRSSQTVLRLTVELLGAGAAVLESRARARAHADGGAGARPSALSAGPVEADIQTRLETLATRLFVDYPSAGGADRVAVAAALSRLFHALLPLGALPALLTASGRHGVLRALDRERVALQGVPVYDSDTGEPDPRLCWAYSSLWIKLLTDAPSDTPPTDVVRAVHDTILGEALAVVHRLDLSYTSPDLEAESSRDGDGGASVATPTNFMDQECLLNLVSFLEATLPRAPRTLFASWASLYFRGLVQLSRARPHVSGLYRLVTLGLRLAEEADLFSSRSPPAAPPAAGDAMDLEENPSAPHRALPPGLRNSLQLYVSHVAIALHRFTDELLCTALQMVLTAPRVLVGRDAVVHALQFALKAGVSHLPTAKAAVGALERWRKESAVAALRAAGDGDDHGAPAHGSPAADDHTIGPYLPKLLPLLDNYLFDAHSSAGGQAGSDDPGRARRGVLTNEKKRKERVAERTPGGVGGGVDTVELEALQQRIVRLLGRLGGQNRFVAIGVEDALARSLAWDATVTPVLFSIPLHVDGTNKIDHVQLPLERLLPRLAELCEQKGDGRTRVLAAECLHASVTYLIGTAFTDAQRDMRQGDSPLLPIWHRLFPTIVALAVDAEAVTRSLFHTILLQLIRLFSTARSTEAEQQALLKALSDGIAEEGGRSAVRELCASGMAEFVKYAIKQAGGKRHTAQSPAVNNLLLRLAHMLVHPDRHKRMGAVQAWGGVYQLLREETALVTKYALYMMWTLLQSLRRAHSDHAALGVAVATSRAVDHAERIIVFSIVKREDAAGLLARVKDEDRPFFPHTLGDLVSELWTHLSAPETAFRQRCTKSFGYFCVLLAESAGGASASSSCSSAGTAYPTSTAAAGQWIRALAQQQRAGGGVAAAVAESFERGLTKAGPPDPAREPDGGEVVRWLAALAGAVDAYVWLLGSSVLEVDEVLGGSPPPQPAVSRGNSGGKRKGGDAGGSSASASPTVPRILSALRSFAERCSGALTALDQADREGGDEEAWAPPPTVLTAGGTQARDLRAFLLRRAVDLVSTLSASPSGVRAVAASGLWSGPFLRLIGQSLLCPSFGELLPPQVDSEEVELYLPAAVERLLVNHRAFEATEGGATLTATIRGLFETHSSWNPLELRLDHGLDSANGRGGSAAATAVDEDDGQGLLRAYRTLRKHGILEDALPHGPGPKIILASHFARLVRRASLPPSPPPSPPPVDVRAD